jgi:lipopolysaccharide/colanic/teichoic acid biosynthesis glycosyltransferase
MLTRAARPLLFFGVIGLVFGLAKIHAAYIGHYDLTGSARFGWTIAYAGLLCLCAYGFGLPDLPRTRRASLSASVGAAFTGAVGISIVQLFVGDALLPRFVVFGSALLLPDWYRLCVRASAGGRTRGEARDRVVMIASSDEVEALREELLASPERPASVVAGLSVAAARAEGANRQPIIDIVAEHAPTVLVLDRHAQDDSQIVSQAATLHAEGVRIRTLSLFYEEWLGKLPISELERVSLLFDIADLHRARYARSKRILDLVVASLGAVVLGLVLPVVLLANALGNRGPIFFRQERIGRLGIPFTILKFRTMTPHAAPSTQGEWTGEDDPRITPFGSVMRKTHIDELPQVLNILRGELSVVGPRPEQPAYVAELSEKLPFYGVRHLAQPGLTGWAQVKYGYAGSESDALEKLQYEFFYLRRQSIGFDLRIIGRTVRAVFGSGGAGR